MYITLYMYMYMYIYIYIYTYIHVYTYKHLCIFDTFAVLDSSGKHLLNTHSAELIHCDFNLINLLNLIYGDGVSLRGPIIHSTRVELPDSSHNMYIVHHIP